MLQPLLFWTRDTADLIKKRDDSKVDNSFNERKEGGVKVPSSQRGVSRKIEVWPKARGEGYAVKYIPHEV